MNSRATSDFLRAQYDRLMAFAVFVLVLGCLILLGTRLGSMEKMKQDFRTRLDQLTPEHPHAATVDVTAYENAKLKLQQPFQIPEWTNSLFVPETRVWCVMCRKPIPYQAGKCPVCGAVQPDPVGVVNPLDKDADGMLDEWEKQNGLDPNDRRDADMDPDRDGFANLEEFKAETNPRDAASSPPIVYKLAVTRIEIIPFNLLFKSILTLPDGTLKFGVNTRDDQTTYWVKVGETVEDFKVTGYEINMVPVTRGGMTSLEDRSILTLQHNNKTIRLIRGKVQEEQDHIVHFVNRVDNSEFEKKVGETFKLKDKEYRLISVDTESDTVVIEQVFDGARWTVGRNPRSGMAFPSAADKGENPG